MLRPQTQDVVHNGRLSTCLGVARATPRGNSFCRRYPLPPSLVLSANRGCRVASQNRQTPVIRRVTETPGGPLIPNECELATVREIHRLRGTRDMPASYRTIARHLTASGVPARHAGAWKAETGRRIVSGRIATSDVPDVARKWSLRSSYVVQH